ncbi:MAG: DNA polymerase III subunit delta [Elusimicrobia bacterium]|nr:DNA polymerase III subunit delta [Elusimicrobiota bacterium]
MELRAAELVKEWRAGTYRPAYLFVGEDVSAQLEAAAALKAALKPDSFNLAEFSGDIDPAAVVSEAMTMPVFSDRRLVVVRSPRLPAEARAALIAYLKRPSASTTLVLLSDERKIDPRDALVKAASAAGAVCLFRPLREEDASARLQAQARQAGKRLAAEAAQALVAEAGTDWAILKQELEKAALFAGDRPEIGLEQVAACLGYHKSADPFALPRLVQARSLKAGLEQARRLLGEGKPGEQAFRVLAQIASAAAKQLRAKRMLKAGLGQAEIFKALRLNEYYDRDFLAILARLSEKRLRRDLRLCLDAEVALKSRSWLAPALELERLLVDICAPA